MNNKAVPIRLCGVYRLFGLVAILFLAVLPGWCSEEDSLFVNSHDSLRAGMSLSEAFTSGLAKYLKRMGTKNVPGATTPEHQPVSDKCSRNVLDVMYEDGKFRVRLFCNINAPSAVQLVPQRTFNDDVSLATALKKDYAVWARNMEFRVESPAKAGFGVYNHYTFVTNDDGRIRDISPIIVHVHTRTSQR